jgi:hypothetical protein
MGRVCLALPRTGTTDEAERSWKLGTQDRRGEMQGLEIGPRWESRIMVKTMGLTRDVLIRVGMLVAALNSRQEDVHEEKRSQMRREVLGFCRC